MMLTQVDQDYGRAMHEDMALRCTKECRMWSRRRRGEGEASPYEAVTCHQIHELLFCPALSTRGPLRQYHVPAPPLLLLSLLIFSKLLSHPPPQHLPQIWPLSNPSYISPAPLAARSPF